ncbi:uncharacterized protein LOC122279188 isoform X2 [Carya illinoinensis]|uniref:uncharacterized protein LOC122279188 isoform X2 n=1 Tax=Carya illinoinensis TaxID=32201 RepID=UPI001C71EA02|nr:uncharacterized protein LOC122279188 isoform X2 [Carya illinoinensis]
MLTDLDSHLISFLRRSAGNGFHFDTEQETESAIVINGKICGFIKTLCRLIKISALQESNPLFPFDHCILCLLIRILQRTGRRIQRTGGRIQCIQNSKIYDGRILRNSYVMPSHLPAGGVIGSILVVVCLFWVGLVEELPMKEMVGKLTTNTM